MFGFARVVRAEIANVHIQRYRALLRPGVHAQVRLCQQHRSRHAAGPMRAVGKGVEQCCYGLQAGLIHGLHAQCPKRLRVGQQSSTALAAVQIRRNVQALHRDDCG